MKTIPSAKFKEQCLKLLDTVSHEGIVITKRGKPVAKLIPIQSSCSDLIGSMKGHVVTKGSIFSTGIKWNAES